MINTQNGSIQFDAPRIHFRRGMTLQQFQESSVIHHFKLTQDLEPCFTYRCESAKANNRTFDVSVWFYSGVILKLSLDVTEPRRPDGDDYFHRNYLRQILGDQAEGEWGSIEYSFGWGLCCLR